MAAFTAAAPVLSARSFFGKKVTKARASAKAPRAAFKVEAAKKSVGDLTEADLKGKVVFVRCDLNVPLNADLEITDDTRIRAAIPTLEYLVKNGAKVLVTSHLVSLGRFPVPSHQRNVSCFGIWAMDTELSAFRYGYWYRFRQPIVPRHGAVLPRRAIRRSRSTVVDMHPRRSRGRRRASSFSPSAELGNVSETTRGINGPRHVRWTPSAPPAPHLVAPDREY